MQVKISCGGERLQITSQFGGLLIHFLGKFIEAKFEQV